MRVATGFLHRPHGRRVRSTIASIRLVSLITTTAVAFSGCSIPQTRALYRAHSAIKEGNYEYALEKLSAAENDIEPTEEQEAEIAFLKARSYEELKRMPEAVSIFRYVADTFPASPYGYLAKEKLRQLEGPGTSASEVQAVIEGREYLGDLRAKVDSSWTHPCANTAAILGCNYQVGYVTLQFGVDRDGQLEFVKVQKSSGIAEYDTHAMNAVKDAAPFDPVPDGLKVREFPLRVQIRFIYSAMKPKTPSLRQRFPLLIVPPVLLLYQSN